jgi:hypothetical protein
MYMYISLTHSLSVVPCYKATTPHLLNLSPSFLYLSLSLSHTHYSTKLTTLNPMEIVSLSVSLSFSLSLYLTEIDSGEEVVGSGVILLHFVSDDTALIMNQRVIRR